MPRSRKRPPATRPPAPSRTTSARKSGSIASPPEYLVFADLDEVAQKAARWVADHFIREDRWPNLVEFARYCYEAKIPIDQLRNDVGHDVFEGSISLMNPIENQAVRVRPWVLYDLGLALGAFDLAHGQFLKLVERLAKGPETNLTVGDQIVDSAVPVAIRRLIGRILVDRYGGSPPDADGKWSAVVEMHDVKVPLPDLPHFIARPRRSWAPVSELATPPGRGGQKPTLWAFISSTLEDLRGHREAALNAALRLKVLPLGMELWTASPQPPLRDCLDALAEADLMILIVGCRYGSLTEDGKSYTEAEYEHALKLKIPVYAFLPSPQHQWTESVRQRQHTRRLEKFIERLRKETTVGIYVSPDDLRSKIIHAVSKAKAGIVGDPFPAGVL